MHLLFLLMMHVLIFFVSLTEAAKVFRFRRLQYGESSSRKRPTASLCPVPSAATTASSSLCDCSPHSASQSLSHDWGHDSHTGPFGDEKDIDSRAVQTGDWHVINAGSSDPFNQPQSAVCMRKSFW
jgi:hypothetical protein